MKTRRLTKNPEFFFNQKWKRIVDQLCLTPFFPAFIVRWRSLAIGPKSADGIQRGCGACLTGSTNRLWVNVAAAAYGQDEEVHSRQHSNQSCLVFPYSAVLSDLCVWLLAMLFCWFSVKQIVSLCMISLSLWYCSGRWWAWLTDPLSSGRRLLPVQLLRWILISSVLTVKSSRLLSVSLLISL